MEEIKEIEKRLDNWITNKPIQNLTPATKSNCFGELPEKINGSPIEDTEAALGMKIAELGRSVCVMGGRTFINRPKTNVLILATNPSDIKLIKGIGGEEIVGNSNIWSVQKGDDLFQAYKKFRDVKFLDDTEIEKNLKSLFTDRDKLLEELKNEITELF